jgi:hypothetical protein
VGTAYEYYAKRLLLAPFLKRMPRPARILVAGLPEKYGSSLDFLLLAAELGARVVVADDRPASLAKAQRSLAAAQEQEMLADVAPHYVRVPGVAGLADVDGPFDLALSCEVMQSLPAGERMAYWQRLRALAPAVALFAPNGGNPAHRKLTGLRTLSLEELSALVGDTPAAEVGLVDLPPFPSGMTRSAEQRQQAATGKVEEIVMAGLGYYARLEKFLPSRVRHRYAHMVYALAIH